MDVSWMHLTCSDAARLFESLPPIPDEIISMILTELCDLSYLSLLRAALANRQFHELSQRHIWRHLTIKTPWPMERIQGCLSMFRFVKTMKVQSKSHGRVDHQKTQEVVNSISQFLREHGNHSSLESFRWDSIISLPSAFVELLLELYPTCQIHIDHYDGYPMPRSIPIPNLNLTSLGVYKQVRPSTTTEPFPIVLDLMLQSATLRRLKIHALREQSTNANPDQPTHSFPFRSHPRSDSFSTSGTSPHVERTPALETLESWGYEFCDDDIEYWADRFIWSRLRTLKLFRASMVSALTSGFLVHTVQKMTSLTVLEMSIPPVAPVGSSPSITIQDTDRASLSAAIVAVRATLLDLTLIGNYRPHLRAISECQGLRRLSLHMLEGEERMMMTNDDLKLVGMGCTKLEEVCVDLDPEVRVGTDINHHSEQQDNGYISSSRIVWPQEFISMFGHRAPPASDPISLPFPHLRAVTFFALGPSKYLTALRPHGQVSMAELVELKKKEDQRRQFRDIAHSLFTFRDTAGGSDSFLTSAPPSQTVAGFESAIRPQTLTLAVVTIKQGEFARDTIFWGDVPGQSYMATIQLRFQEGQDLNDYVFRWEEFL